MTRRDRIRMSGAEVRSLLEQESVMVTSTLGPRGWPHSMPLWYILREPGVEVALPMEAGGVEPWAWTYGKSQKARNLERDPRATLLVEAGEDRYEELRGVMIEAETILHHDDETCVELGRELFLRYSDGLEALPEDTVQAVESQAPKRVAIQFRPVRLASWDHRKLGGGY